MSLIKLYGGRMGSSLRCHWTLHELGIAYTEVPVDLAKGEHKQPPFLALNPAAQIPVLDDDGFILSESLAINNYLADKAGSDLGGSNAQERARVWQWSLWCMFNVQKPLGTLVRPVWTGVPLPSHEDEALRQELAKTLPLLEQRLTTCPFLAGDRFTIADINASTGLAYGLMIHFDFSPYPHIDAWMKTVMARPAYLAAKG